MLQLTVFQLYSARKVKGKTLYLPNNEGVVRKGKAIQLADDEGNGDSFPSKLIWKGKATQLLDDK